MSNLSCLGKCGHYQLDCIEHENSKGSCIADRLAKEGCKHPVNLVLPQTTILASEVKEEMYR